MCIRTGRECLGLPDGPLFVDMTNTAKYGMQKRKSNPLNELTGLLTQDCTHPSKLLIHRISQRAMVMESFYERFLAYFTSDGEERDVRNRNTWLYSLPVLSAGGTNEALTLAIQATAYAYCAVDAADMAMKQHSLKLYGQALRKHSRFVSRSRSEHEVTVHMVSTSVLFSLFEAMQATTADAYRSHIYGAAKLLEVTTPKQCSHGVLCQLFYHLRTQLLLIHLTGHGKETPVEAKRILYGTLEYVQLPIFQRLMGYISTLAEVYFAHKQGVAEQHLDHMAYTTIKNDVESLWLEYAEEAALADTFLVWETASGTMHFRDAFTALAVAYFSAARILLGIIAPQLAIPSIDSTNQHATILQASQYLQIHTAGCAYMRMAAPLLLVALHCPRWSQQRQATACFERWNSKPLSGISALALESIYRHRTSEVYGSTMGPDASVAPFPNRSDLDERDALLSNTLSTSTSKVNVDVVHVGPALRDATRSAGSDVTTSDPFGLA
ncbi:hypothetical protein PTMSG1_00562 [Pyrenophora teres f. maculata]|nr:hypothetical protein PTMSG1_00562 [Pyrenophora teres f. maculata]